MGDLFRGNLPDIEETLNSVYFMMKQRNSDISFRQEVRLKLLKYEDAQRVAQLKLTKEKEKSENLQKKVVEMEHSNKHKLKLAKEERDKITADKDDLSKQVAKLQGKEAQYRHELRHLELQNTKLTD